ncbi:RHS repeat-associated core domain-containing protein [Pseudidiomarina terrestris]|uniref:RHS repeat-associated core domain-containing protein n=1 Tax=Pseudidiomarina terrestris TaxID=2820060 RepID=UPI00264F6C90|nr:RHS repeat-associated core domain-containing protein [Pseudidiomarina sp. 1ASP75-5]MDN7134975.1 hypothetical protein [Pseudidiomarina sp. 1ASP75-5]
MGRVLDFDHQGFNDSSYSYNPASQLQSKTVSNADYQIQVPTLSTEFYSVNNLNQYTQVTVDGLPEYANYTSAGNLAGFDGWSYVYDAHNRLVAANGPDDTVALSYDATGRLTRTVHNGEVIDYLYDGDELVAEYHSNGTLLRRFIHGLGNDDPVIRYEGAGVNARRYLLADERGSTIAEMTSSGALLQAHQYDAYGNPKHSSDARFRFTGQILIPGTELYYYKARVYHPRLGRFMQTDPIGYKDGMNWYAYVGNDPINLLDPTGMYLESLWDAASLSVGLSSLAKNISAGNWGAAGLDALGVIADGAALALPVIPGGASMAITGARQGADFIVSPSGTAMPTNQDFNLVDTQTPTNKGGDWMQIHNTHTDAKVDTTPHTHSPKVHNQNTTREISVTSGADLDKADEALKSGEMRLRANRQDKGGNQ